MQYYMANNRFWLAHRMLLRAQFQSAVRFTTDKCYYLLEEGEAVVEVNGRPLTGVEKRMLDVEPGKLDMRYVLTWRKVCERCLLTLEVSCSRRR